MFWFYKFGVNFIFILYVLSFIYRNRASIWGNSRGEGVAGTTNLS